MYFHVPYVVVCVCFVHVCVCVCARIPCMRVLLYITVPLTNQRSAQLSRKKRTFALHFHAPNSVIRTAYHSSKSTLAASCPSMSRDSPGPASLRQDLCLPMGKGYRLS